MNIVMVFFSYLKQDADGSSHAHHANTNNSHLVVAAHWLLGAHVGNQLLLSGCHFL